MDSRDSKLFIAKSSPLSSKSLLFDRRYGWVLDEWKDPSEEALAGGRGMLVFQFPFMITQIYMLFMVLIFY
ncbi:hypothetical protein CFOL_v3_02903 [Cephalotus follicularis]|uniref:Uncharacterized protein n=1 Tax=Cephalotus follicularis TaxID=3775 RepID=A0A1Q3AUW1_CEPFO|nr:hypothetical protein CFOL_v3_02903 [Cephalotus follicularis]